MTHYKEDHLIAYYPTTHLRKDWSYVIVGVAKNDLIYAHYFSYLRQFLKMDIVDNFMPLDRMKLYTTTLYKKAYE